MEGGCKYGMRVRQTDGNCLMEYGCCDGRRECGRDERMGVLFATVVCLLNCCECRRGVGVGAMEFCGYGHGSICENMSLYGSCDDGVLAQSCVAAMGCGLRLLMETGPMV
ncbi:hypothetical protein O6H91_07G109300 [Diphasiastrum complanatum]|uniref:Uncharacterized protein n=1 Tax=Diphasiastrum complanatum TaxID=34168 RepID=A0ACC2D926_DIPCM|nr:hypothetical protein O6H91_07G109300 [Diphasiastrum complanatum]